MARKATGRRAAPPRAAVAKLADGESTNSFSFGIVFEINGQAVPISAADIADIKKKGVKFELPNPVVLGSFRNLADWLKTKFGVTIPTDTGIAWFDEIINKIIDMQFTVIVFKLDIPGSESEETITKYALQMSGEFQGDALTIPGFDMLGIRGGVFGVTNIPPALQS